MAVSNDDRKLIAWLETDCSNSLTARHKTYSDAARCQLGSKRKGRDRAVGVGYNSRPAWCNVRFFNRVDAS